MTQVDIQSLSLSGISHRCARESERFFNRKEHDPRYCYELFRRAILNRNETAWARIYTQYQYLITHWIERHAAFPGSGEEVQFFMNRAFEKMWLGISPEKFETFSNLKSLLKYLQMCVHSVMVDFVRQKEFKLVVESTEDLLKQPHTEETAVEDSVMDVQDGRKLLAWLQELLQDEQEECIVSEMFILGLKPRELLARHPKLFSDVNEIYRTKENLLARLRRNDELRQFFESA